MCFCVHLINTQILTCVLGNLAPDPPKISSSASQPDLLGGWDSWADTPTVNNAAPTQPKKSTFEGRCRAVMYALFKKIYVKLPIAEANILKPDYRVSRMTVVPKHLFGSWEPCKYGWGRGQRGRWHCSVCAPTVNKWLFSIPVGSTGYPEGAGAGCRPPVWAPLLFRSRLTSIL